MFYITQRMKQDCSEGVNYKCHIPHGLLMDYTSPNGPFCCFFLEIIVRRTSGEHCSSTFFYYSEAEPNHLIFTKCQKHMGINFCKADVLKRKVPWASTSRGHAAPHRSISSSLSLLRQLHLYLRLDFLPVHLNLAETQKEEMRWDKIRYFALNCLGFDHAKQLN